MWSCCDFYWKYFLQSGESLAFDRPQAVYRGLRVLFLILAVLLYLGDGCAAYIMEFFLNEDKTHNGKRIFAFSVPGLVGILGFVFSYAAQNRPHWFQWLIEVAWAKRAVQYVTMVVGTAVSISFEFEKTWHYAIFAISLVSLYLCTRAFVSPVNIGLGTFLLGLMVTTPAALAKETLLYRWIVGSIAAGFASFLHWFFYWFTYLERQIQRWDRPLADYV